MVNQRKPKGRNENKQKKKNYLWLINFALNVEVQKAADHLHQAGSVRSVQKPKKKKYIFI